MHQSLRVYWLLQLLPLFLECNYSLADLFEQCTEQNDQHFIASNASCAHFILCNGEDSYEGECGEGDYFNDQLEMCEAMVEIDCRTGQNFQINNGNGNGNGQQSTSSELQLTTAASTATSVVDQWQTSANNSTVPTEPSKIVTIVATTCPPRDNPNEIVLMGHDKSCTEYFICYRGKPLPMHCAAMLHFNAKTGKCDKAEIVNCLTSTISAREQCKSHTVDIYPHPDNCNYFYYCRNGYLMIQQCPFFYGWDYEKRSCVAIRQAKCFGRNRL